ncbi:MAG TPA: hypothetical protein VFJ16_15330 [Longimicrobium sp.]|nr:hypothetical protein [Longimicrobium sp.]
MLASLAATCAAAPLWAQAPGHTFRAPGFEITLPAGSPEPVPRQEGGSTMYVSTGNGWAIMILRFGPAPVSDTSTAAIQATLRSAATAILRPNPDRTFGDAQEVSFADRIALRKPVTLRGPFGTLHGVDELSISRLGELVLWEVRVSSRANGASADAARNQVLDSFHLTPAP